MHNQSANDVTDLLRAWGAGDVQASAAVAPLVYDELRRQAQLALRREGDGHTLQTTALVHEAWLRLDAQHDMHWDNRTQFFAVAAQMMRRILVDHARRRQSLNRLHGHAKIQQYQLRPPCRKYRPFRHATPALVDGPLAVIDTRTYSESSIYRPAILAGNLSRFCPRLLPKDSRHGPRR